MDLPDWFYERVVYNESAPASTEVVPLLLFVDLPGDRHGGGQIRFIDRSREKITSKRVEEWRPLLAPQAYKKTLALLDSLEPLPK